MKNLCAAGAFLLIVLVTTCFFGPPKNLEPAPTAATVAAPAASAQWQETPAWSEDPLDRERIRQLEAMARRSTQMEAATRDMPAAREHARAATSNAWKQVISTHQAAFQGLLAQARKSEKGEVPCTICDGLSYTRCVMCRDRDGKCIACLGSGHGLKDIICSTCLGSGKCYLCTGSGKMFCPFCDDGMIQSQRPPPPNSPPVH